MAEPIASAVAGRVNRRFLFLALILAALSAVLVYAALSRSDSGGGGTPAVGVPVVVAKAAIPAGTAITADMLEVRQLPEAAIGDQALSSADAAVGEVARFPIAANEQVLASKLVGGTEAVSNDVLSNILETGERGMAIQAQAVIGAGGLVLPGDYVDVLWVPDSPRDDVPGAQLLAEDVEVVAVEQTLVDLPPSAPGLPSEGDPPATTADGEQRVRGAEAEPIPEAITVTLMVTIEEAQRIFCGDTGGEIRLAIRAFGDHSPSGLTPVTCIILGEGE